MAKRDEPNLSEEIVRLLVLQLRMRLGNQASAIVELSRAGFGPSRIAELLGTSPGTVNVALQRAKKATKVRGARVELEPDEEG
jgi:DNA-directed RNA polymerase specialized sigma24 family protein